MEEAAVFQCVECIAEVHVHSVHILVATCSISIYMDEPLQVAAWVTPGSESLLRGAENSKVLGKVHQDLHDEAGPTFVDIVSKANGPFDGQ
jgi:hypothetical protein